MATSPVRILVTGAGGQLGSDIVKILTADFAVIGTTHAELDVTDRDRIDGAMALHRPDAVIHCAAWTDVDACESDPDRAMRINSQGTRNLAKACRDFGATMVYFSTDYVFDGLKLAPYVESDTCNPQSVYGKSKLAGEMAVRETLVDHVICRTSWVYGDSGRNFIKSILRQSRSYVDDDASGKTPQPLRVVADQVGCPTHTSDIARQIGLILREGLRGTIHTVSAGSLSWCELAREIVAHRGMDVPIESCTTEELARPAPRPRYSVMKNQRLDEAGLNIMPHYHESLLRFLDQLQKDQN